MYNATQVQSHTLEKYRTVENILNYNEYLDFKCWAMEIILYRLVKTRKSCSSFPVKNNNEQLVVADYCRLELLLSLFQGINFKQK